MLAEPSRERVSGTIWQELNRLMPFEVNQDCSVDPPFLKRKIVNTKHPWSDSQCKCMLTKQPYKRIVAHPHPEFVSKSTARHATKGIGHAV